MTQSRRGAPDWGRILLPASLLVNLFLVALIIGNLWGSGSRGGGRAPLAQALARAEGVLSTRDAAAFRTVMRADAPRYAQSALELRAARRALDRQLAADPFDRAQAASALAAWRAAWSRFMDDFQGPLLDGLAQISPDGRRRLISDRRVPRLGGSRP